MRKYIQQVKGMFLYSAVSSPLARSKHFTLLPWRTCSFRHQIDFSGKHSSQATIPPLLIARYLFIQSLGRRGKNENAQVLLKLEYLFTDYDTWDLVVRQYTVAPILRYHLEQKHGHVCFANGLCPQSSEI